MTTRVCSWFLIMAILAIASAATGRCWNRMPTALDPLELQQHFESANVPCSIPDNGTVESTLTVNRFRAFVHHVTVDVRIDHTRDQDLTLTLIGPDGTEVILAQNRGGNGQNYGSGSQRTVFDDNSLNLLALGAAPFVGTFHPEQMLIPFYEKPGTGVWTLRVNDNHAGAIGTLLNWSLTLSTDYIATEEGTPTPVTLNGSDPDGDPLTYRIFTSPGKGTLSGTAPNLTYTPSAGKTGPDLFSFTVKDGRLTSLPRVVAIIIFSKNHAAVANAQNLSTNEDTPKAVTLTGSDVDGDSLHFRVATRPAHGTLSGTVPNLTYTPDPNWSGSDSFTFTAYDGIEDSAAAVVALTVNAVNDAPVAYAQSLTTNEDTPKAVTLTGSDIENDPLTYRVVNPPAHGTLSGTAPNLTYTPGADWFGSDSFTFVANDGTVDSLPATVGFTVNAVNDAPVADAQILTTNEDTPKAITLTGSDVDGDGITYRLMTSPAHGSLSGTAPNLTYTPSANWFGSDSFTFVVNDGMLDSSPAIIGITVMAVNDAPVADAQSLATNEDTPKAITLTGSDIDGDALSYRVTASPAHGILSGTAPNLTYTPDADWFGSDCFTFVANDGTIDSPSAVVNITVTAVNDAPVADAQTLTTNEDTPKAFTLTGSDVDGDAMTYRVVTAPVHGTLSGVAPNLTFTPSANWFGSDSFTFVVNDGTLDSTPAVIGITVTAVNDVPVADAQSLTTSEDTPKAITLTGSDVDGDALSYRVTASPAHGALSGTAPNLTYTPAADWFGSDSFTFVANDGTIDSSPATVNITVTAVNDAPVANGQTLTTAEDTSLPIVLTAADVENDPLTYRMVANPSHGRLVGQLPNIMYSPTANYTGSDSFTFRVTDGRAYSNTARVTITVQPVNDPPVAGSQTVATSEDTPKAITLAGSDVDGDPLSVRIVSDPAHGTLAGTGLNLVYTPNADWFGSDSFTYVVNDGAVDSGIGRVTITVAPVNDKPIATAQTMTTDEDTPKSITLSATDVDGDTLSFWVATRPAHGTLNGIEPNLTYTPDADWTGTDSFAFTAHDGKVVSDAASITIVVQPVNDPPQNAALNVVAVAGSPLSIEVPSHVTDIEGDTLTVTAVSPAAHGATALVDAAHVSFTGEAGYSGADQFTCTVQDTSGATAVVTINATIYAPLTAVALGFTPVAPRLINTPITVMATPAGGAQLEYFFRAGYLLNGAWYWPNIRAWGPANSWTWTPTAPGTYTVVAMVRDTVSGQLVSASQVYQINGALSAVDFTFSARSPQAVNSPITLTATAVNGLNVRYRFWVTHKTSTGQWITEEVQPYSASNTCAWRPGQPGLYTVVVWAREATSRKSYDVYKSRCFTVQ